MMGEYAPPQSLPDVDSFVATSRIQTAGAGGVGGGPPNPHSRIKLLRRILRVGGSADLRPTAVDNRPYVFRILVQPVGNRRDPSR